MKPNDHIKSSNYTFIEEVELSLLEDYSSHRRLGVFYHKGTVCANPECDRVGTRFIYGKDNGGSLHLDVYTDDMILMTVDHVIPLSKNGSDDLDNKEPMCYPCNNRKGNSFEGVDKFHTLGQTKKEQGKKNKMANNYGREWRKCIRKHFTMEFIGIGNLLVDNLNPSMLELLRRSKEYRDSMK